MSNTFTSATEIIQHYTNLIKKNSDNTNGDTAIMAGHQVLTANASLANLGIFPALTADIARTIQNNVQSTSGKVVKLFTLIDDKRWLDSSEVREDFWNKQKEENTLAIGLPKDTLESFCLSEKRIDNALYGLWSEKALMTKFSSRLKRVPGLKNLVNNQVAEITAWEQGSGVEKEACMSDGCNINGCSREVIEMLTELSKRKIARIIMLVPHSCESGIEHACEIATSNPATFFGNDVAVKVHNCFLNSGLARLGGIIPQTETEVLKYCSTSSH